MGKKKKKPAKTHSSLKTELKLQNFSKSVLYNKNTMPKDVNRNNRYTNDTDQIGC